jgi:acyl-CoA synthetase (AMP-forming)/AMP-acid ligase II
VSTSTTRKEAVMDLDTETLVGRRADARHERLSMGDLLERSVWGRPDHTALVGRPGAWAVPRFDRLTYREADRAANRIAHALVRSGVRQGDRLVMLCDNSVEALLLKIGAAKAGVVVAPLNPMMADDVLMALLDRVEPAFAVVDAELWTRSAGAFRAAGVQADVTIEIGGAAAPGTAGFADWIEGAPDTEPDVRVHGDDICELLFSSGTTALPKAVMVSHTYAYLCGYSFALPLTRGLSHADELCVGTFLPVVFHGGHMASVVPTFLCGGTLVLGRRHDPAATVAAVVEEQVTALWAGSPQLVESVVAQAEKTGVTLTSLTVGIFAWRSIDPALRIRLEAVAGGPVELVEILAQTEALAGVRFSLRQYEEIFASTAPQQNVVGVPDPIVAADVVDAEGRTVRGRPDVPGEVVYRSPALAAGYYRDPAATAEAFRDGWFHSGDSCTVRDDGLFVMVDRFKDIVKSGGENVSSQRVEAVVLGHPAIERVAVVGMPDERWGEAVTAVVVLRPGATVDEPELLAHCRRRLAGYETPKRVVVVDSLPETVGGKVRKHALRAQLADRAPADLRPAEEGNTWNTA